MKLWTIQSIRRPILVVLIRRMVLKVVVQEEEEESKFESHETAYNPSNFYRTFITLPRMGITLNDKENLVHLHQLIQAIFQTLNIPLKTWIVLHQKIMR